MTHDALETLWETRLKDRAKQHKYEFLQLLRFIQAREYRSVLEIGCYKGGTALGFLEVGCSVVSVDIKPTVEALELVYQYKDFSILEQDSKTATLESKFDVLYIDGDHSYEAVKQDHERFKGNVQAGGIIVFHDCADSQLHITQKCGVPQYWKELKAVRAPYQYMEIITEGTWGGLGVLFV